MSQPTRRELAEAVLVMLETHPPKRVSTALAGYLVAHRRSKELDAIMRDIESLRKNREGIVEATAISASELSEATKRSLQALLGGAKNHIVYRQDPAVVGGVKLQAADWQLDLSVSSKLKRLKHLTVKAK